MQPQVMPDGVVVIVKASALRTILAQETAAAITVELPIACAQVNGYPSLMRRVAAVERHQMSRKRYIALVRAGV